MANIEKRISKAGDISYRVKIRIKGAPTITETFKRLTDARIWAQSQEAAIREGRHFPKSIAKRKTLADLIDKYSKDYLPLKKDGKNQTRHLKWWRKELGFYTLADVTPAVIADARDTLLEGDRKGATVIRYMASLSHVFTIAMKEYGWIEDNPFRKVTKPREARGRVRYLPDTEREELLKACKNSVNPDLYFAVVLALCTGARRSEQMNLTWEQVDLERGTILLHETKNGDRRTLPLTGPALELMEERSRIRRLDTNLIFPSNKNPRKPIYFEAAWRIAKEEAKIEDFKWHDLRHTFASYLAMNGATLPEIAAALGHRTLQMVQRYAHISQPHVQAIVGKMTGAVFG